MVSLARSRMLSQGEGHVARVARQEAVDSFKKVEAGTATREDKAKINMIAIARTLGDGACHRPRQKRPRKRPLIACHRTVVAS